LLNLSEAQKEAIRQAAKIELCLKLYEEFAQNNIKIVDKNGEKVSFLHNEIQKKINQTVKQLRADNKPVRIIILKARQEGVSTNEQGRMIYNTTTKSNRTGLIVAHEQPATAKIFEKARYMYNNLPEGFKPLTRASNARELIFDTPTGYKGTERGLNSKISIQVAGDVGIGRGDTLYYVHLSEFAFWPAPEGKEPKKQLAGILQAVPKTAETEVVIESTANGYNDFKELWDDAVAGNNEWTPLFFAWWAMKDYQMPCTDEEYEKLLNGLSKAHREYIEGIVKLYELTKHQIKWYLWTLKNDCNGDWNMMKQENPSTPEEAFISTGSPVFDNEKVQARIEYLRKKYEKQPPKKGRFHFEWNDPETQDYIKKESIKWVDDHNGIITIYEDKKDNYPYVIGGDTKGEGRDKYAGTVINNVTGNRCAVLHMQATNSKPYTWQMYCMGLYFNEALIGIEMNFNTAPIEELTRLKYPRQYVRQKYDDFTKAAEKKYGWKTDGNTRPLIIDKEVGLIENNIDLFNDITMLSECLTFVHDKDGRPDAMSGKHDDVLLSDMIAAEIRTQQRFSVMDTFKPDLSGISPDALQDYYNATLEGKRHLLEQWGRGKEQVVGKQGELTIIKRNGKRVYV
jgi:hypothetical protein